MTTKFKAILAINPNIILSQNGDEFIIHNNEEMPSNAEIEAKLTELQAEYDAQEYARNRSSEYPTWQEQMDMQYWDAKNGTNTWQEAIEAVKTKYPKGK